IAWGRLRAVAQHAQLTDKTCKTWNPADRPLEWRARSSSGSQVGVSKRLDDRSVRVLFAVSKSLSRDAGDHAHIDGSGPKARRLIADIKHRCRGAILWRQPKQIFAARPPDNYDMVR